MRRLVRRVVESTMLLLVSFVALASPAEKIHTEKVEVRFLARSTAVRSSWGGNQDIYLVELRPEKSSQFILAKLLDEYPSYAAPIANSLLSSATEGQLKVERSSFCDVLYARMPIRSSAGDNIAILPEKLNFQPSLSETPSSGAMLPCYRRVR